MTPFLSYLLKANLILILLYGFYYVFLKRDTFYSSIRYYLLITLIATIVFPFINISEWLNRNETVVEVSQYIPDINAIYLLILAQSSAESATETIVSKPISFETILMWCFLLGTVCLFAKRLFQLTGLGCLYYRSPKQHYGKQSIVVTNRDMQPFSFFGQIFLNPSLYQEEELNEIMAHEQIHCRKSHTIDILLAETVACLCWFNPIAWLLRYNLKQNIEFYTDRKVLQTGFDRKHYQYNLLRTSGNTYQIVNHFHFNHLKKRIIMMNKKDSPHILSAKYVLAIPAFMAAMLVTQASGLQPNQSVSLIDQMVDAPKPQTDILIDLVEGSSITSNRQASQYVIEEKGGVTVQPPTNEHNTNATLIETSGMIFPENTNVTILNSNSTIRHHNKAFNPAPNDPLVIIDGKEYSQDMNLFPEDIAVIEVLKDASTASYGEKGKNGVVIITTKTGAKQNTLPNTNSDTLYIIDGVERSTINGIQRTDIESIDVLKGPAAMAYGEKGENGVVIVTTKNKTRQNISPNTDVLYIIDGKECFDTGNLSPEDVESIEVIKGPSTAPYGEKGKNGVIFIKTKRGATSALSNTDNHVAELTKKADMKNKEDGISNTASKEHSQVIGYARISDSPNNDNKQLYIKKDQDGNITVSNRAKNNDEN